MAGEPKDKDITDKERAEMLGTGMARSAADDIRKRKKKRQSVMRDLGLKKKKKGKK